MTKPTLIILPGWGGTKESWQEFITEAAKIFSVRCIELPGFGQEPAPTSVWGVAEYAQFVKQKINNLGIGQKIILGHSFGGQVATYLVGNNPQICDTLILSGPAVFRREPGTKQAVLKPVARAGQWLFSLPGLRAFAGLARKILYKSIGSPDYNQTRGIMREIFQKVITEDVSEYLKKITINTLVLAGTKDTYVPLADSQRVAVQLPHGTVREFIGGHGLHQSQPAEIVNAIQEYLSISNV